MPLCECEKLKVLSPHIAVAPSGVLPVVLCAGPCTTSPALSTYCPCSLSCSSTGAPGINSGLRSVCASPALAEAKIETAMINARNIGSLDRIKSACHVVAVSVSVAIIPESVRAEELPTNPAVTQATIGETICIPGWTKTVRPSARYTARIKIKLIRELELDEALLVDFELDHRIPLALGGAPSDPRNLELQPWDEAPQKDAVEACLAHAVCAGKITLDDARERIWRDWRKVGLNCDGGG